MDGKRKGAAFRNGQFLKVVLIFCITATLLNLGIWFGTEYLRVYNISIAVIITTLMHLSGLQVLRVDDVLYIAHSTWQVTTECNAMYIMAIFSSFVLAFPSSFKEKCAVLLAGIPFIFGANVTRLYVMAWIDSLRPEYSGYFHDYLWQVVFIIMVVFMWIVWIDWINGRENKTAVSR